MKTTLYDKSGKKKSEIELPAIFSTTVREDIVLKFFEVDKSIQPYAAMERAGLRQSASGRISHKRHDWKGHYGRGVSRMPKKTMWRRGTQFFWVGANVPATRGGRKAHPPKGIGADKKINKKEIRIAFNSAFAATANPDFIAKRYASLDKIDSVPYVIESIPKKTKDLIQALKNILGEKIILALKKKTQRAGKGKLRGRKYKSNAGILIITGVKEETRLAGFDIHPLNNLSISNLYPLGRLTLYTKAAIEELSIAKEKKK